MGGTRVRGDAPFKWADGGPRVGGTCGPTWSSVGARSVRFSFLGVAGLLEAIALAVHLEDVDVVGDPVQQRAGEALGAEDFGPFIERRELSPQARSARCLKSVAVTADGRFAVSGVNGGVKVRHLGGVKIHHYWLGSLST